MENLSEHFFFIIFSSIVAFISILGIRLTTCLPWFDKKRGKLRKSSNCKVNTMIVWGSGGHTGEMILLLKKLSIRNFEPVHYVLAETDKTSKEKIMSAELEISEKVNWHYIVRSREVKQKWITTVLTTGISLCYSLRMIARIRPNLIICNGPGTCVPLCYVSFLFKLFGFMDMKIVFVESFCRVEQLSLTGKFLYPIADKFIVQWQQLLVNYPRAEYLGDRK